MSKSTQSANNMKNRKGKSKMKQPINVLSCFDGMSCGHIALDRAGIPVKNYFASEIDKFAIKITRKTILSQSGL